MIRRNRTLRKSKAIREMVAETQVTVNDLLLPLFITEGKGVKEEISSMPGYYRLSLDNLKKEIAEIHSLGIKSVLLFVKVPDNIKRLQMCLGRS